MRFIYEAKSAWPPNAWLALLRPGDASVVVRHGDGVQTNPGWFCEAAWDGEFEQGGFDLSDIVTGSGGRLRDGVLTLVSSGSTVDRLQFCRSGGRILASNSLVCLFAATGYSPDATYGGYYADFRSVIMGLQRHKRVVRTAGGKIELCYFDNLTWDGAALRRSAKPDLRRDFSSFDTYRVFLESTMGRVVENAASPARKLPYRALGTLSSGYDSTAITVIGRGVGLSEVLTFDRARGDNDDSGAEIARVLGLTPIIVRRDAWRDCRYPEAPFLAANAYGEEVHYKGAETVLRGRLLLTGFHGDKMWAKDTRELGPDVVRGDPTGLALTEYRLWTGFLHCPVPFWGVRQIADLSRISNDPGMRAWDVPGDYSRPICRRIAEEAGVPRHAFGQKKKAASVVFWSPQEGFLTPASSEDCVRWLQTRFWRFVARGKPPPALRAALHRGRVGLARPLVRRLPALERLPLLRRLAKQGPPPLFRHLFPWAVDVARERYLD